MTPAKNDLPRRAHDKLVRLTIMADEAETLAASTQHRIRECEEAISLADEKTSLNELNRELDALRGARGAHQRRRDAMKATLANIRHWLERVPLGAPLEHMQPTLPKLKDGETAKDAVNRVQAEIEGKQIELMMARQAVLPKGDLKLSASKYVENLIAKAKPSIRATADGVQIRWNATLAGPPTSGDIAGVVAYLDNGVALKKALHAEIDKMDHRNSMSKDEKTNVIDRLREEMSRLERDEEALIELAQQGGIQIDRRPNANPAAILGVKIGKVEKPKDVEHPKKLAEFMQRTA